MTSTYIHHPTHPHPLTASDNDEDGMMHPFLCNGCRTPGTGKRYKCNHHGCNNFDLHDFCSSCPPTLHSFMHPQHPLKLLMLKKTQRKLSSRSCCGGICKSPDRICDVCGENIEGLFYNCKKCKFSVHPLCTQLPEGLLHALDAFGHKLRLEHHYVSGVCRVCGGVCDGWRYRCGEQECELDIHIGCVLHRSVGYSAKAAQTGESTPHFQGKTQFQPPAPEHNIGSYYAYGHHGYHGNPFGAGYNYMNQGHHNVPPNNFNNNGNGIGSLCNMMFALVQQLAIGVVADMIFGMDCFQFGG